MDDIPNDEAFAVKLKHVLDELERMSRAEDCIEEVSAKDLCDGEVDCVRVYSANNNKYLFLDDLLNVLAWFYRKNNISQSQNAKFDLKIDSINVGNSDKEESVICDVVCTKELTIENLRTFFQVQNNTELSSSKHETNTVAPKSNEERMSYVPENREEALFEKQSCLVENKDTEFFFSDEWTNEMIETVISKVTKSKCEEDGSLKGDGNDRKLSHKENNKAFKRIKHEISDRPFICTLQNCNRAFKRLEHLKRHHRIHTGERPFRCTYPGCYKTFARSDNLSQHLKIHNASSIYKIEPSIDALDFMKRSF